MSTLVGRPFSIIKFCNEILRFYKSRTRRGTKFENADVIGARERYSEYLLKELDDEIHKHVPGYRDYLEILKSIGSLQFSAEQFKHEWDKRLDLSAGEMQSALRDLFEFSVIGYQKIGGGGGGSKYVWRYLDSRSRFADDADTFRVHSGFKESLDLIKGATEPERH